LRLQLDKLLFRTLQCALLSIKLFPGHQIHFGKSLLQRGAHSLFCFLSHGLSLRHQSIDALGQFIQQITIQGWPPAAQDLQLDYAEISHLLKANPYHGSVNRTFWFLPLFVHWQIKAHQNGALLIPGSCHARLDA